MVWGVQISNRKGAEMPDQIYEKSWKGNYEGSDGAIATARAQFQHKFGDGYLPALMELASTIYSAAGNNFAKFSSLPKWQLVAKFKLGFRAWRYLRETSKK